MDTRDGTIYPTKAEAMRMAGDFAKEMKLPPSVNQRKAGKVGRNDPCPCGSGKKFKKCCHFQPTPQMMFDHRERAIK